MKSQRSLTKFAAIAFISLVAVVGVSQAQDTDAGIDPVLERQLTMQQLEEHSNALGNVLAGLEPPGNLGEYTRAIANDALAVRASFQQNAPGGASRPEIWSNWEDFSSRLDHLVAKTEEMAVLGESGNLSGVNEIVVDALPCRQCHQVYRVQD